MKKVKYLIMAAIPAVMFSCNTAENKTTDSDPIAVMETPVTTAPVVVNEGKTVVISNNAVPSKVQTTFANKYPKAERVEWMTYEPVEYDNIIMTGTTDTIYYVKYYDNGSEYYNWYNANGEWLRSRTQFIGGSEKLPAAVNATLTEKYPGFEVVEIDKENDKDMEMYELELKKGEEKAKLKILPDGKIFKVKS